HGDGGARRQVVDQRSGVVQRQDLEPGAHRLLELARTHVRSPRSSYAGACSTRLGMSLVGSRNGFSTTTASCGPCGASTTSWVPTSREALGPIAYPMLRPRRVE